MYRNGILLLVLLFFMSLTACTNGSGNTPTPGTPENLTLTTIGPNHVKLNWSIEPTKLDSFIIERSENNLEFSPIASVNAETFEFIDDGISLDTTYTYQVYASFKKERSDPATSESYSHPNIETCNTPMSAPAEPTSIFYDIPVSGLTYTYENSYFNTDSKGAFTWDGSTPVHFSIGYIDFGYLKAGDKAGLMSIARNYNADTRVTINNLLRLLTTIDEDNDASNGIQISCQASLAFGEIDPTLNYDAFAQQETVYRLTNGTPLLSASDARTRYERYLYQDYVGHYEANWSVVVEGIVPISATIPFDINRNGDITNIGESITKAKLDPHKDYRLQIVDLAPLVLVNLGFYKLEIDANIRPDKTIEGEVILKNAILGDIKGNVWGGRIE